jgi:hypothetical protein
MEQGKQSVRMGAQPETDLSCEAAKILRKAFRTLMRGISKGEPFRFSHESLAVLRKECQAGQSFQPAWQETQMLVGFEFARNGELNVNLLAPICGTSSQDDGSFTPDVAPFMPINMAGAAGGTTHIKMASIAAELDLERGILRVVNLMSAILPWEGTATTTLEQYHMLKVNSSRPVYLALGMVCYRERSGVMFALKNGKFNPLTIVRAASRQNSRL